MPTNAQSHKKEQGAVAVTFGLLAVFLIAFGVGAASVKGFKLTQD